MPSGNAYRTAALKIISNLNLSMPIQNYTRYKTDKHAALICFYRAMHFSAKRGIAIACRLSVCLSVCNVGEL